MHRVATARGMPMSCGCSRVGSGSATAANPRAASGVPEAAEEFFTHQDYLHCQGRNGSGDARFHGWAAAMTHGVST
jgi:hypothetical protein